VPATEAKNDGSFSMEYLGNDPKENKMSSISVLYMSMSMDGFIAGPNDEPDNPGGDGFMRLHEWYGFETNPPNTQGTGWGAHFMEEGNATGAVLAGRRTVEQVDHWAEITMASRFSCPATGRRVPRWRTIRW
jgi:dihydrofolate reductase